MENHVKNFLREKEQIGKAKDPAVIEKVSQLKLTIWHDEIKKIAG